ncbi:MAG: alpha/beta hydrolase [Candidatus Hermodarchaeota archaeon]
MVQPSIIKIDYKFKSTRILVENLVAFLTIKKISQLSALLNPICIICGISYLIFPDYIIFWDILGILIIVTLFVNGLLVYLSSTKVNKATKLGKKINLICYVYLVFMILALMGIIGGNLLIYANYTNLMINSFGGYFLIYFCYISLFVFSFLIALFDIKNINNNILWNSENNIGNSVSNGRLKRVLKRILTILSSITFIIGGLCAFVTLFGSYEIVTTIFAIFSSQFGAFFSLIFLANMLLLFKLKKHKWKPKKIKRKTIAGLVISFVMLLPLIFTHITIFTANKNFSNAFGGDWQSIIPSNVNNHFLRTPFTTSGYFLGIRPKNCIVEEHTLFYDGEGINLYFDAYMPLKNGVGLPGQNSTILSIHGGGWILGDKGGSDRIPFNKYLAAQGYIVFDIQYGLFDSFLTPIDPVTPRYTKGDFNIDDMVRHIGIFTNYLAANAQKYGANLDSVFVTGGSSGGHLTCATALAIANGNYSDILNSTLTIKGIMPYYPANGMASWFGIDGREEFKNPEILIEENSPPCLIFQGTHDILNYFGIATNLRDIYLSHNNKQCAIIWMPLGGHGCDFYYPGYYTQIFLYYMERFLYLYR